MGLKEKGADGDKGEGVVAGGGGAHDDDDHGGEAGHRSKDEDEVSCWFERDDGKFCDAVSGYGDYVRFLAVEMIGILSMAPAFRLVSLIFSLEWCWPWFLTLQ